MTKLIGYARVSARQQSTDGQESTSSALASGATTSTSTTASPALGQMGHEIKRERVVDSINKRRDAGKDLGGRPRIITDSQIRNARRLIAGREPAAQVPRDLRISRATFYRRPHALGTLTEPPDDETLTSDGAI